MTRLRSKCGRLHLLLSISTYNGRSQFELWRVLERNPQWSVWSRWTISNKILSKLFPKYVPRNEEGKSWRPEIIDYIVLIPKYCE